MNDLYQGIISRRSESALTDPAPNSEQLKLAFTAAIKAPDHGCLKPWRFFVIEKDKRMELGKIYASAIQKDQPQLTDKQLEKTVQQPLRAPMIIVVTSAIDSTNKKIPVLEQQLAVGCAVQNLQLALNALGFDCIWRTGPLARHSIVRKAFNVKENDEIISFLYVGTSQNTEKKICAVDLADQVTWINW